MCTFRVPCRPAGTCGGGEVKVKVDFFRSGGHRVGTDGDLPAFGSRFPLGHGGTAGKSIGMKTKRGRGSINRKQGRDRS